MCVKPIRSYVGAAALALLVAGCPADNASQQAPLLGPEHMGWKNPSCSACKTLPVQGHTANQPPECAACHGGNGACDPNGVANASRQHDPAVDDCLACHMANHGFAASSDCVACHFARNGLDDTCGIDPPDDGGDGGSDGGIDGGVDGGDEVADGGDAGPPTLSNAVVESCYGWPEQEFSPQNNSGGVRTGLAEGALAVELSLTDTRGTPHRLSELLADRPVLLWFGAFT